LKHDAVCFFVWVWVWGMDDFEGEGGYQVVREDWKESMESSKYRCYGTLQKLEDE